MVEVDVEDLFDRVFGGCMAQSTGMSGSCSDDIQTVMEKCEELAGWNRVSICKKIGDMVWQLAKHTHKFMPCLQGKKEMVVSLEHNSSR